MRTIILTVLLLFSFETGNSQDYIPMLDSTNLWYIFHGGEGGETYLYRTKNDSVKNNLIYKLLEYKIWDGDYNRGFQFIGLLREDTAERKVYYFYGKEKGEVLYFDFSLKQNDSVMVSNLEDDSIAYYYVDSVKYIETLAGERKAIYLNNPELYDWIGQPIWVEGIGSLGNIIWPDYSPGMNEVELLCFFRNGVKEYRSKLSADNDTCVIFYSSVDEIKYPDVRIYPNPAGSFINIELKQETSFSVYIYDYYGRLVFQKRDIKMIDTGKLAPGVYIIKVSTNNFIFNQKMILLD